MGKATITGGGADGFYNVQMQYSDEYYEAIKKMKQKQITDIEKRQDALEIDIAALEDETDSAIHQYQLVVDAYAEALKLAAQIGEKVPAADYNYAEWYDYARTTSINLGTRRRQYEANKIQLATLQKQLEAIEAKKNAPAKGVWCADFIEDAEGDCGIIDIPGEPGEQIMQPQYQGAGAYSAGRDGILMPRAWPSPASAYYNFAILPGIQRWRPTYRLGTLIDIDYDNNSGEVELMAATSSAQSLNVNPPNTLLTVQFAYMECNAEAFEVGDAVVVKLEGDWENPLVIGFRKRPQPCPVRVEYLVEEGLEITPPELATQRVKKGENTEPVTASVIPGMDWVKFWKWDDELTEDTRSEQDVQVPLKFTAKAVYFLREIRVNPSEWNAQTFYGNGTHAERDYLVRRWAAGGGTSLSLIPDHQDNPWPVGLLAADFSCPTRIVWTYNGSAGPMGLDQIVLDQGDSPVPDAIYIYPPSGGWTIDPSYEGGFSFSRIGYGRPEYAECVGPYTQEKRYVFGDSDWRYYRITCTFKRWFEWDYGEENPLRTITSTPREGSVTFEEIPRSSLIDVLETIDGTPIKEVITATHLESGLTLDYYKSHKEGLYYIYLPVPGS